MDPKGQLPGPLCRSLPEIHKAAAYKRIARFKSPGMGGRVLALCWKLKDVTLILDEAQTILGRQCPVSRLRMFNEGRGRNIGMILVSTRPTKIHTDCQNLEILAVGTLLGAADTAVRSSWGVKEALPPHTFEIINLGMSPPRKRIETVPMPRHLG